MSIQELMAQHFGIIYQIAADNVAGLTHEQSLVQPPHGANCANWILGHVARVQNGVMRVVGEKPVWESDQLARAGFDPITGPANAIDWDTLKSRFFGSRERCVAAIAALSDDALAEAVPHPFGGTCSRAEFLNFVAFHQAYHTGQLGVARRLAGLDGVVKGPGQR
jgi:uncharacterized damage-inducible protein DinB